MPKVSIIIPNYNHAKYLNQRIDSVLNQTFQDFELIILDDCSTDNSKEIIDTYKVHPKVSVIIYNDFNSGSTFKQWQKGIYLAKGEYIWIAESDDWAEKNLLETLLELIPNGEFAYCHSVFEQENNSYTFNEHRLSHKVHFADDFLKQKLLYGNPIDNVSMALFRKKSFEKIAWDEITKYRLCGDWLIYGIIASHSDKVIECHQNLNHFRRHDESVSSQSDKIGLFFIEGVQIVSFLKKKYALAFMRQVNS